MPRPGFELRQMDDEERRRARAHRKLRWQRRRPLVLGILILLVLLLAVLRLAGFAAG
jgi:hypothetical protein